MLPLLLHAHYSLTNEDLPLWLSLANRYGSPCLELGCGTGRVLKFLAESGFAAFGLDLDGSVLALAHQMAAPGMHLLQADMRFFPLQTHFGLIYSPCNTFSTFSPAERRAILAQAAAHLQPEGAFAFSIPNPAYLQSLPHISPPEVEDSFPHPLDGQPVQVSAAWKRAANRFHLEWIYDHLLPDGRVERLQAATSHDLSSAPVYQQELRQAGLFLSDVYGDYDRSPYDPEDSPYLILVGRAPARSASR